MLLGSLDILTSIRMKTPYSYSTSFDWWRCYSITKGVAVVPRASCVLQPPDSDSERARYLGCEKAARHLGPLSAFDCPRKPKLIMWVTESF
jgi:hypothetical protein